MNLTNAARIGTALLVGTLAVNAQVSNYIAPYTPSLTTLVSLGTAPNQSTLSGSFSATLSGNAINLSVFADAKGAYSSVTPTISPLAPAELRTGSTLGSSTLVGLLPGTVTSQNTGFFGVTVTEVSFTAPSQTFSATPGKYWVLVKGLYGAPGTAGTQTDILSGTFTVVPEPETYAAAAALGLVGFGLWRRRNA